MPHRLTTWLIVWAGLAMPAMAQSDFDTSYPGVAPIIVPENDADIGAEIKEGELPLNQSPVLVGTFKMLDKVTGKVRQIALRTDEITTVSSLAVVMRFCVTAPPEEAPETRAFVEISEARDEGMAPLFAGWMFASSPGLNALEHPVYDFWPVICKKPDGKIFSDSE